MKIPKVPGDWKNWTSAQNFCVKEGGTLVAIENEVEQGTQWPVRQKSPFLFKHQ